MIVAAGVSNGVGISKAKVLKKNKKRPAHKSLNGIDYELERVDYCTAKAGEELKNIEGMLPSACKGMVSPLIKKYIDIINSNQLISDIKREIKDNGVTAEYAITHIMEVYKKSIENLDDEYLFSKSQDIEDISSRLLDKLTDKKLAEHGGIYEECIVVSDDLTMTDILNMDFRFIKGIVTIHGGPASGSAAIARLLNIPAVVGAGEEGSHIKNGDILIVDANCGRVIINPDEHKLRTYGRPYLLQ